MRREFSAGGILVREVDGEWQAAVIRPAGKPEGMWALPKGNIDPGEQPDATAVREVAEETGASGEVEGKLGDVKYTYTWAGERIFKIVSFYLVRYTGGTLGELPEATRHEVDEARWVPLADAPRLLAHKGEREMAKKALEAIGRGGPAA